MNPHQLGTDLLKNLFCKRTSFIDVRAPVEFKAGSLPGAVNLPILNDEERALIGTTYKKEGSAAAIKLGHELVSGVTKEKRVEQWQNHIAKNPDVVLYCFRGGLRSQITQQWLREAGVERPLLAGGFKAARNFLINQLAELAQTEELTVISGCTGSGKTRLLAELQNSFSTLDLEALACHRGSAFGNFNRPQPAQIDFENRLTVEWMNLLLDKTQIPLVEDESRLIGRCVLPLSFFEKLRSSPVIWIEEPIENRVQNIYQDYILDSPIACGDESQSLEQFAKYKKSLHAIQKKLGGLRTQEVLSLLQTAESDFIKNRGLEKNRVWIEMLLRYYYDPLYLSSVQRRQVQIIFRGTRAECAAYLKNRG